jgi:transmembrane sensor
MNNVHHLNIDNTNEDQVLEQACDWIAKLDKGLNKQQIVLFQQWLHLCPENMATMLEVAQMWDKMEDVTRLADMFPLTKSKQSKRPVWLGAIAASLFIVISFSFLTPLKNIDVFSAEQSNIIAANSFSYQTSIGETSTIQLPDSSELLLNTNSSVNITYTAQARVIELQRGEIHIDVAHDTVRPLSVLAGGQVIQAVGTAFNVQLEEDLVELIVTQGKVLVQEKPIEEFQLLIDTNNTKLSLNERSISKDEKIELILGNDAIQKTVKVDSRDIATKLSWRKGKLIFTGESLEEVLVEIGRYTKVQFELEQNSSIQGVKVAGIFKTGDVTGLLKVLARNFNINHEKVSEDKIKLHYQG